MAEHYLVTEPDDDAVIPADIQHRVDRGVTMHPAGKERACGVGLEVIQLLLHFDDAQRIDYVVPRPPHGSVARAAHGGR